MDTSLAPRAQPSRQTWPAFDDDDQAPFEEWALDEIDSEFALPTANAHRTFDAAFD